MDDELGWHYNCIDCAATWEITQVMSQLVKKLGFTEQFRERMEMLDIAYEMMNRGIALDHAERQRQVMYTINEQSKLQSYLDRVLPQDYKQLVKGKTSKSDWHSSPAQSAALFYDILGCKEIINKKTGNRTLDDDALLRIKTQYPLLEQLVEPLQWMRSLGVILSNFLTARTDDDNRMRCTFDPTGTDTFRWSSYENAFWRGTNLQNIPTERDE